MNRKRSTIRWALAALGIAALAAPATAAERIYDNAVAKLIDGTNSGLKKFVREMSSTAKGARVTRDGVETDISDFLEDFQTEGKRLDERFTEGASGDQNVLAFLKKAKATDGFIARHPGFTGAETEWAAMKPTMMSLGAAYGIDWNADPETWKPSRVRDTEIAGMLKGLSTQTKGLNKALNTAGKAAKVDKAALKALNSQVNGLSSATSTLSKNFSKKLPIGPSVSSYADALGKVQDAATQLGLGADTVPAMQSLGNTASNLGRALGI